MERILDYPGGSTYSHKTFQAENFSGHAQRDVAEAGEPPSVKRQWTPIVEGGPPGEHGKNSK